MTERSQQEQDLPHQGGIAVVMVQIQELRRIVEKTLERHEARLSRNEEEVQQLRMWRASEEGKQAADASSRTKSGNIVADNKGLITVTVAITTALGAAVTLITQLVEPLLKGTGAQ